MSFRVIGRAFICVAVWWAGLFPSVSAADSTEGVPDCLAPPAGLVTWLAGEGNAGDVMARHHGVIFGGLSYAQGVVDRAFSFDGVDDWINVWPGFDLQTFTFAMWVKEGERQEGLADILDSNHSTHCGIVIQHGQWKEHEYLIAVGDAVIEPVFLSSGGLAASRFFAERPGVGLGLRGW